MNFHPLSIKLLRKGEIEPIYLEKREEMDSYEIYPLVSLELKDVTFHVGDIVYVKDKFYIFTMIPSIKLNQFGLESFGFVSLREEKEFFYNINNDNYYNSSKKQININLYSDDIFNFANYGINNALAMSNEKYEFICNLFYMDIDHIISLMTDILIEKYPNKELNIKVDEVFNKISTFHAANFRFPINFKKYEKNLEILMKKSEYDNLWHVSSTNDWSFRLIVTNNALIKRLESISSNSYFAGTIFEFREDDTNKSLIKEIVDSSRQYKSFIDNHLDNQKQILVYLTKEGNIEYVDREMNLIKDSMPLIPLREKFFDVTNKYRDKHYNEKILNIIG